MLSIYVFALSPPPFPTVCTGIGGITARRATAQVRPTFLVLPFVFIIHHFLTKFNSSGVIFAIDKT